MRMDIIFGKLGNKLLGFLAINNNDEFYVRELARKFGVSPMGALKELNKLESKGYILSRARGRERYFSIEKKHPLFNEIKSIAIKSYGVADAIANKLKIMKGIEQAFIYGSAARGDFDSFSDIDIMIIGAVKYAAICQSLDSLEKTLNREINFDLLSPKEFEDKKAKKDPFITDVMNNERIYLINDGTI